MSRKNQAPKLEVLPDPLYNSKLVTRLIKRVMLDGKRGTAAS
ncbi:30S ribosomal protein S7, partial [Streptococcus suis]